MLRAELEGGPLILYMSLMTARYDRCSFSAMQIPRIAYSQESQKKGLKMTWQLSVLCFERVRREGRAGESKKPGSRLQKVQEGSGEREMAIYPMSICFPADLLL